MFEKLAKFTISYHVALERVMDELNRTSLPFYGAPTTIIHVIKASDGYVTFYFVEPPGVQGVEAHRGYHAIDYSEYTLDTICQATSLRMLRVGSANIGQPMTAWPDIPPDADKPADLEGNNFSVETREAARSGALVGMGLPAMMICPVIDVRNGIRQSISPARLKVWSPTVEIPGQGR